MSVEDNKARHALIHNVVTKLRSAGVQLYGASFQWHVTKTYPKPEGFEFTCENPRALQALADRSQRLVVDFDYVPPSGLSPWPCSVGYTEIGEGARAHIDIGIESSKLCRAFIDPKGTVVGRDQGTGLAVRNLKG